MWESFVFIVKRVIYWQYEIISNHWKFCWVYLIQMWDQIVLWIRTNKSANKFEIWKWKLPCVLFFYFCNIYLAGFIGHNGMSWIEIVSTWTWTRDSFLECHTATVAPFGERVSIIEERKYPPHFGLPIPFIYHILHPGKRQIIIQPFICLFSIFNLECIRQLSIAFILNVVWFSAIFQRIFLLNFSRRK